MVRIILWMILCCWSMTSWSQLSIQNTLETQYGKLPDEEADPFASIYDRLIARYRMKPWTASVTIEQYQSKYDNRNYFALSQRQLRYKKKKWDVKLGNFYETIGRGTMLRSYEIRGSVLEDISFRSRNYFHRDILGGIARYRTKKLTLMAMHGYSLNNVLPPTFDRADRRVDQVSTVGAEMRLPRRHKVGLALMNHKLADLDGRQYGSLSGSGPLVGPLKYTAELSMDLTDAGAYALYGSVNGATGTLSYSLEYKQYRNFVIGSGINEPPALIKQHTYKVLNRSTHVTNPDSEEGYQLDIFYLFENGASLTFNHALAYNDFSGFDRLFREYFIEYSSDIGDHVSQKIFVDLAQDPLKDEKNRISAGCYGDIRLGDHIAVRPEVELQTMERSSGLVNNQSYTLGFKYGSDLFAALQLEGTTDPFLLRSGQDSRYYLGGIVDYKVNSKHGIKLFAGERRGGPLCSAGICYEILDFRGLEIRWTSRW